MVCLQIQYWLKGNYLFMYLLIKPSVTFLLTFAVGRGGVGGMWRKSHRLGGLGGTQIAPSTLPVTYILSPFFHFPFLLYEQLPNCDVMTKAGVTKAQTGQIEMGGSIILERIFCMSTIKVFFCVCVLTKGWYFALIDTVLCPPVSLLNTVHCGPSHFYLT